MPIKLYLAIALRIIILFAVGLMMTFVFPHLRYFFGDTLKSIPDVVINGTPVYRGVDERWDWGARHYWYFCCVFILFILSLINCVLSIYNLVSKQYSKQ